MWYVKIKMFLYFDPIFFHFIFIHLVFLSFSHLPITLYNFSLYLGLRVFKIGVAIKKNHIYLKFSVALAYSQKTVHTHLFFG